jgi:hypothetical protein
MSEQNQEMGTAEQEQTAEEMRRQGVKDFLDRVNDRLNAYDYTVREEVDGSYTVMDESGEPQWKQTANQLGALIDCDLDEMEMDAHLDLVDKITDYFNAE